MAIYTRFGTEVTVRDADIDDRGVWLKVKTADGRDREWNLADFKADQGLAEIIETVRQAVPPETFAKCFPGSA